MRIQASLTAAAVNLKRLAGAILAALLSMLAAIAGAINAPIARRLASPAARAA